MSESDFSIPGYRISECNSAGFPSTLYAEGQLNFDMAGDLDRPALAIHEVRFLHIGDFDVEAALQTRKSVEERLS